MDANDKRRLKSLAIAGLIVVIILLLLRRSRAVPGNTTIVKGGGITVPGMAGNDLGDFNVTIPRGGDYIGASTPRGPDYSWTIPGPEDIWDWMNTSADGVTDIRYRAAMEPAPLIVEPLVYFVNNRLPVKPTITLPEPEPIKTFTRRVWNSSLRKLAVNDSERWGNKDTVDEVFVSTDGKIFNWSKAKIPGAIGSNDWYVVGDRLHYRGEVYQHDPRTDMFRGLLAYGSVMTSR